MKEFALQILFLLIPGIIALGVIKSIGPKRPRSDLESTLQIFMYGTLSYAVVGFLEGVRHWFGVPPPRPAFWEYVGDATTALAVLKPDSGVSPLNVFWGAVTAIVIGSAVAILQSRSFPHRVLRTLKITGRPNEVDIWGFTFNSPSIDTWITVRHPNGKTYQGWLRGYSDGGDERELLIADVAVYLPDPARANELIEVDSVPVLYLGIDRKNTVVELRETQNSERRARWLRRGRIFLRAILASLFEILIRSPLASVLRHLRRRRSHRVTPRVHL